MNKRPTRGLGNIQPGRVLPILAEIKKGGRKTTYVENGITKTAIGPDLSYFRFVYNEDDPDVARFITGLGSEPRAIPFVFPYAELDRNFEPNNDCYKGGILIHRCDALAPAGQPARLWKALDPNTYHPVILKGFNLQTGEEAYCTGEPVYRTQKAEYYCSLAARLHIAPLGIGKPGEFTMVIKSPIDARMLRGQLRTILDEMTPEARRGSLMGVPLILKRVLRDIPYIDEKDGKRKVSSKWMLEIEPDANFARAWLRFAVQGVYEAMTIGPGGEPALTSRDLLEAPEPEEEKGPSLEALSGYEAAPDLADQPAPEPEARPRAEPTPAHAITSPPAQSQPAKSRKLAKVAGSADKAFRTAADEWAKRYTRYASQGDHADYNHILAAALAEGYREITESNIRAMLEQVGQRHAIETQAEETA